LSFGNEAENDLVQFEVSYSNLIREIAQKLKLFVRKSDNRT